LRVIVAKFITMKKNLIYYRIGIILIAFMGVSFFAKAGSPSLIKSQSTLKSPEWSFRENRGQLMDENNKPLNDILYYGKQGGVNIYCKPGMISFVFTKTEQEYKVSEATGQRENNPIDKFIKNNQTPTSISAERVELELLNANLKAEITASDQQAYYENYYTTGNANNGINNIHTYKTITYKNIYSNIDLVIHAKPNGMKYEFVVYHGGNVADIQIQWNGLKKIKAIENGGISYSLNLTNMKENNPYTYQGSKEIASSFTQKRNHISFKTGSYDKTKTLVIDPTLIWGTYYGGSADDDGYGITTDDSNNIYITGWTESTTGIATNGAYQTSYAGGGGNYGYNAGDAFVAKFNSSDSLLWATYYGGTLNDCGFGVTADVNNNIYIVGQTESLNGIATRGAYQTTPGGGFIAKFNSKGSLSWGTYYNGSGEGITHDKNNNIYVTGLADSNNGIATSGAYQTSYSGFCFVSKFSPSGSLLWGTYYGGNMITYGYGIAIDLNNNVYITGATNSTSGIATKGAYQTLKGGSGGDAFLAKFSSNGDSLLWGTYYGFDVTQTNGVTTDFNNNVYITGSTDYASLGIATSGANQTSYGGGNSDAFLAKFTSNGGLSWATYYGGSGDDVGNGITHDKNNNIYITGSTTSKNNIITSGAYKHSNNDGGFLAKFSMYGSLVWGTYYGKGNAITTDTSNNVYITGNTNYSINASIKIDSDLATKNTYQTSYSGGSSWGDAFVAKFNFCNIIDKIIPNQNRCSGTSISINNPSMLNVKYNWTSSPLGFTSTSSEPKVSSIDTTTYYLIAIDTLTGCNSESSITINPLPDAHWKPDIVLFYKVVEFISDNFKSKSYLWHFGNGDTSIYPNPTDTFKADGNYKVSLLVTSDSGCTSEFDSTIDITYLTGINNLKPDVFNLIISPNPFTSTLSINYTLPQSQTITLTITDIAGKPIATLANENQSMGQHIYTLDADKFSIPAGVYFVRIAVSGEAIEQKIIRLKE